MPRILRRVVAILVLVGAWALVGSDRAPLPVSMGEAIAGMSHTGGSGLQQGAERPSHDLANPRLFTKVVLHVKDNYVDQKRIKPREMMISGLEYVEKTVPDVIVRGDAESGEVKISVNGQEQTFDISNVDSLWKMSFAMKDIFRFIGEHMRPIEDTRDVEYAAINGMLSKLDPHSVLLRPEIYREMKLSTRGEFGGLGFVIQMKEGNLTVNRVLPQTPAHRAGIRKEDRIRKIGEESTVNMDLNEAVSKLRGPVDSKITITLERDAWKKARPLTLSRAMITIESVQSKLLAENVGYIRLKNFQGNTTRDMQAALRAMEKEAQPKGGMKGLVLDMRGNPGGLLDQAIQVADEFIDAGVLVSTVGLADKLREEKRAHPAQADKRYPIAVLVNAGSASASEIVAGALKNLDRAVIIGRQTFGKGSVQVLYDFPDESALKLTIAKYLTPGDISIQEVGIVPDIELVPTRVTEERVDVFAPRKSMGEADLESHFGQSANGPVAKGRDEVLGREKALYALKYLKVDSEGVDPSAKAQLLKEGKDPKGEPSGEEEPALDIPAGEIDAELDDQLDAEAQDEIKEDFEVLFARDFVLRAPFLERKRMLAQGRAFVQSKQKEEEERINSAIGELGVEWRPGPTPRDARLTATLSPTADEVIPAGSLLELELTVKNGGTTRLRRVRAWTESENAYLDRREFLIGALEPGQSRSWKVPVRLPKDLASRRDEVKVKLLDESGELGEPLSAELNFAQLARPRFAFSWQVVDSCKGCNGDGLVQRGETVDVLVDVTNTGKGAALDAFAQIKNAGGEHVFIEKGRFKIGELAPGETKTSRFQLELKTAYRGESFPLRFAVIDEPLEEFASDRIEFPVGRPDVEVEQRAQVVRLSHGTELLQSSQPDARVLGRLPRGATLSSDAKVNGVYRVTLEKDRFAFVKAEKARVLSRGKPATPKMELSGFRQPPRIDLATDVSLGGLISEKERFTLSGTIAHPGHPVDLYVLVNDQKVFYKAVEGGKDGGRIEFTTEFDLEEGNNAVMVVARENQDFASRKTLIIRRRPAALAQQSQPAERPPAAR